MITVVGCWWHLLDALHTVVVVVVVNVVVHSF